MVLGQGLARHIDDPMLLELIDDASDLMHPGKSIRSVIEYWILSALSATTNTTGRLAFPPAALRIIH